MSDLLKESQAIGLTDVASLSCFTSDISSRRWLTAEGAIHAFKDTLQAHLSSSKSNKEILKLFFQDLFGTDQIEELVRNWPVVDYLQRIADQEPIAVIITKNLRSEYYDTKPRMASLVGDLIEEIELIEENIMSQRSQLLAVHTDMAVIESNLREYFDKRRQEITDYHQKLIDRAEGEEVKEYWEAERDRQIATVDPHEFVYRSSLEEAESPTGRLLQRLGESSPDDQERAARAFQEEIDPTSQLYIGRAFWSVLLCQGVGTQNISDFAQVEETDLMRLVNQYLASLTIDSKTELATACQRRCNTPEQATAYARGMIHYLDGLLFVRADRYERTLSLADAVNGALARVEKEKVMATEVRNKQVMDAIGIEKPGEESSEANHLLWSLGERYVDGSFSPDQEDWNSVRTLVTSIGENDRILPLGAIDDLEAVSAFLTQAEGNQEIVFALGSSGRFTKLGTGARISQGILCLVAAGENSAFVESWEQQEKFRKERKAERKAQKEERTRVARQDVAERAFSAWQQLLLSQKEALNDLQTASAEVFLIGGRDGLNPQEVRQQLETVLADKGQVYVVGKDPVSVVPPGEPRQLRLVQVVEVQRLTRGLKIELKDMAGKTLASMTLRDFVVHNNGLIFLDGDQVAHLSELRIQRAQGRQQAQAEQALAQQKIAQAEAENILFTQAEVLDNQRGPAGSLLKQVLAIEGRRIAVGQEALIEIQQVLSAGGRVWGGELISIRQSRVFQVLEVKDIRDDRILVCRIVGDESAGEVTRRVTEFKGFVLLDKERTGQLEQQTSAGDRSQTAVAEAAVPRVVVEPERDKARVGAAASTAAEQNWQLLRGVIERKWKTGIGIARRDLLGQVNAEEDLIIEGARVKAEFASIQNQEVTIFTKDGARKVRVAQKNYGDFVNVHSVSDEKEILAIVIPGGAKRRK